MNTGAQNLLHVYNPANQTRDELITNYVIRLNEYQTILQDINRWHGNAVPRHFLIQGQRGTGKTTLLLRLYYQIMHDNEPAGKLIPIRFDEEQYNIRTVYKLWENVAAYLEDERVPGFEGLFEEMEDIADLPAYESRCFSLLEDRLNQGDLRLALFIDNFGDLLHKFQPLEIRTLSEILRTRSRIKIIGTSAMPIDFDEDGMHSIQRLFNIIRLEGLNQKDTTALLLKLGEYYGTASVRGILENAPERIEALRRLTGGIPRTIVLLFEIFVDNDTGDSFRDLEIILDRVTPLYKHRMDDLSPQQQEIVHAIAMNWDAVGVREISKITRMESKAVSSQLKQLEMSRIIIKIRTNIKNHFYQVNERFFNIWYLMRYGRRKDRNKVLWLIRFLENWCNREELIERAERHLMALRRGSLYEKHALYMTEALSRTDIPEDLQYLIVRETRRLLAERNRDLLEELSKSDRELYNAFTLNYADKEYSRALQNLLDIKNKNDFVFGMLGFLYEVHQHDYMRAIEYYRTAIDKGNRSMILNLANLYETEMADYENAEKYYLLAYRHGNPDGLLRLAVMHEESTGRLRKAMQYYRLLARKGHSEAMNNLALMFQNITKEYDRAEKYYLKAAENGHTGAMINLAWLYFIRRRNKADAFDLLDRAFRSEKKITNAFVCAMVLLWNNSFDEAIIRSGEFMEDEDMIANFSVGIQPYLMLLIAKKQYNYVLELFNLNHFNIRDRYKPIYYALMYLMQDSYPDEYRRMGDELKLTVDEILQQVQQLEKDYA